MNFDVKSLVQYKSGGGTPVATHSILSITTSVPFNILVMSVFGNVIRGTKVEIAVMIYIPMILFSSFKDRFEI